MDLAPQTPARGPMLNQTITTTTTTTTTTTASSSYGPPGHRQNVPRSSRGVPPPGAATTAGNNNTNIMTIPASTTELTGDQGWPSRVVGEMRDMLLLLTPDRTVVYASPSTKAVTGYDPTQLERNDLLQYIHSDDQAIFSEEMDGCIANGRPLQCHFRFARADKAPCVLEAYGHPHVEGKPAPAARCHGVFLVCRPYPTKSSQLLDSFLEHKIENIRLNQRIAQLKEEEEEELSGANPPPAGAIRAVAPPQPVNQESSTSSEENESSDSLALEDNERLTSDLSSGDDLSHIEGIEVMTGLFYGDGERSQGLSTGQRQGRLVQCGMEMVTADQQARTIQETDRRKRLKGEYMCTDCGTCDSPEWRKGPEGPKTLCNACGLRWAKKEKKRQD